MTRRKSTRAVEQTYSLEHVVAMARAMLRKNNDYGRETCTATRATHIYTSGRDRASHPQTLMESYRCRAGIRAGTDMWRSEAYWLHGPRRTRSGALPLKDQAWRGAIYDDATEHVHYRCRYISGLRRVEEAAGRSVKRRLPGSSLLSLFILRRCYSARQGLSSGLNAIPSGYVKAV